MLFACEHNFKRFCEKLYLLPWKLIQDMRCGTQCKKSFVQKQNQSLDKATCPELPRRLPPTWWVILSLVLLDIAPFAYPEKFDSRETNSRFLAYMCFFFKHKLCIILRICALKLPGRRKNLTNGPIKAHVGTFYICFQNVDLLFGLFVYLLSFCIYLYFWIIFRC